MMRRGWTVLIGAVVLLVLSIGLSVLPVPYVALGPGPTIDTLGKVKGKDVVAITGGAESSSAGHLNLTTVSVQDKLDLGTALKLWIDRSEAVVPRELVIPPDQTEQQTQKQNTEEFKGSQSAAQTAALAALGHPVKVVVEDLPKDSPSTGKLAKGDVIVEVDGVKVTSRAKAIELVRARKPGDEITISYLRGGKPGTAKVAGEQSTDSDKHTVVGLQLGQQQDSPYTISFQVGQQIGGPSAGLMFALAITDKLTPDDLTGGIFIAGTGTIDDDGTVGPIGGIPQKMLAARGAGATVFLAPAANCAEAAKNRPGGLRLIKVSSLTDALGSLEKLRKHQAGIPAC
jgi:PDZ domain-containing protein